MSIREFISTIEEAAKKRIKTSLHEYDNWERRGSSLVITDEFGGGTLSGSRNSSVWRMGGPNQRDVTYYVLTTDSGMPFVSLNAYSYGNDDELGEAGEVSFQEHQVDEYLGRRWESMSEKALINKMSRHL